MSYYALMPVRTLFLATLAAVAAYGQSVVSVRSGLINFSEGEVFLGGRPVEQKAGKFPEVGEDVELRTDAGRAEVLLTPGMVLRVGPDSAIRLTSASLIDTRVEFRRGSAVVEVSQDPDGTMARIYYRDYVIRFPKRGTFRIDSTPREFRVYEGEAEVSYLGERCRLVKDQRASLYGGLEARTLQRSISDGLDEWSMRRDTQLAADNPPAGDLNGDPAFALPTSSIYGLSSYSSPVTFYSYSPYTYIPGLSPYIYVPLPVYVYRGFGSSPVINRPPVRFPVRTPILGYPRGLTPSASHPVTPLRPAIVGRPK